MGLEAAMEQPISVCIIARNEAENLKRCLGSVRGWVSEIIVVVNDCTDSTVEVARSFGARVFEEPWHGHRDQKNVALAKASAPWILCLDADEEVSPELRRAICAHVERDDPGYDGAFFARKVWLMGRWITHGDWYPDYKLRLVRRGRGRFGGKLEHDRMEIEGRACRLPGELLHYTCPSLNQHLQKIPYYSDFFLERQLAEGARWCLPEVLFRSVWRFFRAYVLRRGFLDGFPGFYVASYTAFATFFRYTRLYEHLQGNPLPPGEGSR